MAKRKFLNIRSHLEHVALVVDGLQKYGLCPALVDEIATIKLINQAILRKHKESGTRQDIRLNSPPRST